MGRKGSAKVLKLLHEVYGSEIAAVGIYMDQHAKCDDMGYDKMAETFKKDAVEEMKHAEKLMERILFLGSNIMYSKHDVPKESETDVAKMVKADIAIEIAAIERLNKGIKLCYDEGDNGSRLLLEEILRDEEAHLDSYEKILANIEKYGDKYIVTHLM